MKCKRVLTFCITIFLVFCLVGCGEASTSKAVANNLEKTASKLSSVVSNLDDVNYNDIVIEEISPLSDNTFNTVSNNKVAQKTKWYTIGSKANISDLDNINKANKPSAKYVNNKNSNIYKTTNKSKECEDGACYNSNSTYSPKYVNNVSNTFNRNNINSYLQKVENLYNNCADCVSCNAECKNAKNILKQNLTDCKVLCEKLRDGTITLTEQDITECNSYINQLMECVNRLKSTSGNITSKCNEVNKLKANFTSNIGTIQDAYTRLLTAMETRLECINCCNETFNCIFDIINKTNVNKSEALPNKSDQNDVKDYTENGESVKMQKPILNQNAPQRKEEPIEVLDNNNYKNQNNQNIPNDISRNNQQNYYNQTQIPNNNTNTLPNQQQNIARNNIPNVNNGLNNNNVNNGYGVYNNQYPYPPRNIDTYHTINKNIDTYRPNAPIANNYGNANNYETLQPYAKAENTTQNRNNDVKDKYNIKKVKPLSKSEIDAINNNKVNNIEKQPRIKQNESISENNKSVKPLESKKYNIPKEKDLNNNYVRQIDNEKTAENINNQNLEKNFDNNKNEKVENVNTNNQLNNDTVENINTTDNNVKTEKGTSPLPNPFDENKIKEQKENMQKNNEITTVDATNDNSNKANDNNDITNKVDIDLDKINNAKKEINADKKSVNKKLQDSIEKELNTNKITIVKN